MTTESIPWREKPFLPLKVASDIVGLSIGSLYKYEKDGALKFQILGGRTMVNTQSLIALVDAAVEYTPRNVAVKARAARKMNRTKV